MLFKDSLSLFCVSQSTCAAHSPQLSLAKLACQAWDGGRFETPVSVRATGYVLPSFFKPAIKESGVGRIETEPRIENTVITGTITGPFRARMHIT